MIILYFCQVFSFGFATWPHLRFAGNPKAKHCELKLQPGTNATLWPRCKTQPQRKVFRPLVA